MSERVHQSMTILLVRSLASKNLILISIACEIRLRQTNKPIKANFCSTNLKCAPQTEDAEHVDEDDARDANVDDKKREARRSTKKAGARQFARRMFAR